VGQVRGSPIQPCDGAASSTQCGRLRCHPRRHVVIQRQRCPDVARATHHRWWRSVDPRRRSNRRCADRLAHAEGPSLRQQRSSAASVRKRTTNLCSLRENASFITRLWATFAIASSSQHRGPHRWVRATAWKSSSNRRGREPGLRSLLRSRLSRTRPWCRRRGHSRPAPQRMGRRASHPLARAYRRGSLRRSGDNEATTATPTWAL